MSRRGGHVAANLKIFGAFGLLSGMQALRIFNPILPAAYKVHAALTHRLLQDIRVGEDKIGGRDHIQHLAGREFHHVLVLFGDALNTGGGVVPPLLVQQKRLVDEVERPVLPSLAAEPSVLG